MGDLKKDLDWLKTRQIRWNETVDVEKQITTMSLKDRDIILNDKDKIYDIAEKAINRAIEAEEKVTALTEENKALLEGGGKWSISPTRR